MCGVCMCVWSVCVECCVCVCVVLATDKRAYKRNSNGPQVQRYPHTMHS